MSASSGIPFYPCCGTDINWPIEEFKKRVTEFWFVERDFTPDNSRLAKLPSNVKFLQEDAVQAFLRVSNIKVFVFKRDHDVGPGGGEGSSSIRWFDEPLRGRVLAKLCDQALVVTDGSNTTLGSFAKYFDQMNVPVDAPLPDAFTYGDQRFDCSRRLPRIEGYGPVFLWAVHRRRLLARSASRATSC